MRVGSSEPHGEPECAKFGRVGCSSRQRHKLHQPLRCNVLVPNGSCHYLSDMAHFDLEEITLPIKYIFREKLRVKSFLNGDSYSPLSEDNAGDPRDRASDSHSNLEGHFRGDEWFSVKAANPVFFVRSYGIDRNNSVTPAPAPAVIAVHRLCAIASMVIEALELITNYC
ncbi:hypothetical protein G5I_05920 [Acromyrmex echinatior]|uniref:Uncharacterized protein n=1 Tax=Acromyrmex echinatior TaxID=103372 RepID=F4WJN9_ACREC|nr:hypothetical protein G5I_05920 [Acromyrmex echinatior]